MNQKGFTLIELIVIIVILGILAVTAIPKYVDMQNDAANAACEGMAGAIAGASAINYAADLMETSSGVNNTDVEELIVANVCTLAILSPMLTDPAALTANFTMGAATGDCTPGAGTVVTCNIVHGTFTTQNANVNVICTDSGV